MSIRRILKLLICLAFCQATTAFADCGIINSVDRISSAHLRALNQVGPLTNTGEITIMRQELNRLDAQNIKNALTAADLESRTAHVIRYVVQISSLSRLVHAGNDNAIRRLLQTTQQSGALSAALSAIPAFGCDTRIQPNDLPNPEELVKGATALRAEQTRSDHIQFQIKVSYTFVLSIIAAIIAIVGLMFWHKQAQLMRERKGKRYLTDIPVFVRFSRQTAISRVKDLSCRGAKLSCEGTFAPKANAIISVCFETDWHAAVVSWSNRHYCGVQFQEPLSISDLGTLVAPETARARILALQTKTAPEPRTPFSN